MSMSQADEIPRQFIAGILPVCCVAATAATDGAANSGVVGVGSIKATARYRIDLYRVTRTSVGDVGRRAGSCKVDSVQSILRFDSDAHCLRHFST